MEALKHIVKRDIFYHHMIKRNKHVAMYDMTLDGEIIGYEVFIIRRQKAEKRIIRGAEVEFKERELYPHDEAFGYTAWAPRTREQAEERFQALTIRMEAEEMGVSAN